MLVVGISPLKIVGIAFVVLCLGIVQFVVHPLNRNNIRKHVPSIHNHSNSMETQAPQGNPSPSQGNGSPGTANGGHSLPPGAHSNPYTPVSSVDPNFSPPTTCPNMTPDPPGDDSNLKEHVFVFRGTPAKCQDIANATSYLLRKESAPCAPLEVTVIPSSNSCNWQHTLPQEINAECTLYRIICDASPEKLTLSTQYDVLTDTNYRYVAQCPQKCYSSTMIYQPSPVFCPNRNRTVWGSRHRGKYNSSHGDSYLIEKTFSNFTTWECNMIGVNMTVSIDNSISTTDANEGEKIAFALNEFRYFVEHVRFFGTFDLNEYRVVVKNGGNIQSEDERGLLYPPTEIRQQVYWLGEKQSHEIAHAFIGGHIRFYDWRASIGLGEGLTHLMGLLGTQSPMYVRETNGDVDYYTNQLLAQKMDLPLNRMSVYSNTKWGLSYYVKGSFLYAVLGLKINAIKPQAFCLLMRWLLNNHRTDVTIEIMSDAVNTVLGESKTQFDSLSYFTSYFNSTAVFPSEDLKQLVFIQSTLRDCPALV
eukprot:PhF_6_TR26262/c0_g1_i1/m.37580